MVAQVKGRYEAQGEKVYEIPIGGSNTLGLLGYYECAVELTGQALAQGIPGARVVCSVGSMGTYMGLFCGLKNERSPLRLTGISIMPQEPGLEQRLLAYFEQAKAAWGLDCTASADEFDVRTDYTRGGYNNPSPEVRQAIYLMARREAVILDPCYTGKAFAGVIDMVKEGRLQRGEQVIFLHTGGLPGIYTKHHREAFEQELVGGVHILD